MDNTYEEAQHEVYYIPENYEDAGGVLGGRFTQRNAIELCVICGPIAILEYNVLHFSWTTNIIIAMVTLLPLALVCAFGIQGESISQIIIAYFRFRKNRRKLSYIDFCDSQESKSARQKLLALFERKNSAPAETEPVQSKHTEKSTSHKTNTKTHSHTVSTDDTARPPKRAPKAHESSSKEAIPTPTKAKKTKHTAQNHNRWINPAMKEMLLRKFELGDDDDDYPAEIFF